MPAPRGDARLEILSRDDVARLAALYDHFANALDPFAKGRDEAEQEFNRDIRQCFDVASIQTPAIREMGFVTFRREVLTRCRKHLKAADSPATRRSDILNRKPPGISS